MKSLSDQMLAYSRYHRDVRNKATHFVGVPVVVFSLFLFLSWFRFAPGGSLSPLPVSAATLFFAGTLLYYWCLDRVIALVSGLCSTVLLYCADVVAGWPMPESAGVFVGAFVVGWIIQLVGHGFEGKRPALVDNLTQIFNAPMFLTVEVLFILGLRRELKEQITGQLGEEHRL